MGAKSMLSGIKSPFAGSCVAAHPGFCRIWFGQAALPPMTNKKSRCKAAFLIKGENDDLFTMRNRA
jgi:hypothetical protein